MSEKSFVIRPLHPNDVADLHAIMLNPAVYSTLVRVPSLELAEVESWAKKEVNGRYRYVVEADGHAIAMGSLTHNQRGRMHHSGNMGMYVSPDYWGQGVGTLLLKNLLDLSDNWLNLNRLQLEVFTENETAIHMYKTAGFEIEGIEKAVAFGNGKWLDDYVMARLRNVPTRENRSTWQPPKQTRKRPSAIKIRPYLKTDVSAIHQMMTDVGVSRTTLQLPAYELAFYESRSDPNPQRHRLMAEADGKLLGMVSIYVSDNARMAHSAGLGMMVHPDYWGMGIGSQLMDAILDLADNWLNIKRVYLDVNIDNPAAVRLYEKFGFEIEGTKRLHTYGDGRWADSYFMGRVRA